MIFSVASSSALATAFVYDTGTEFLTSGDFNGDGQTDILILDESTGNARIGYLGSSNVLSWSAPLSSQVENVSGLAVGPFYASGKDSLAVTAPNLNRINLVDLSNSNSAPTPTSLLPQGIGPHTLVTLPNPQNVPSPSAPTLMVASSANGLPAELVESDLVSNTIATALGSFGESGSFERGNTLQLSGAPSLAVGMVRGATADELDILQFTNGAGGVLCAWTNLPSGSDYAMGFFNGEGLPRFLAYQSGGTNVITVPLINNSGTLEFGTNSYLTVTQALQQVFYLPPATSGTFLLQSATGIQALTFSGASPVVGASYSAGLANTNSLFTGLIPLSNGQFVLLDAAAGSSSSTHAQVMSFNGTTFTKKSASFLPATSSRTTRANIWLFQSEPFVNSNPGFIASLKLPDWSDAIINLAGTVTAVGENDGGPGPGLNGSITNNLGSTPAGAAFSLANQYQPAISIFSYAAPRPPEPVVVTISPSPGIYSGSVQISFSTLLPTDQVFYRAGAADVWHPYAAAFTLTNSADVQYYGTNAAGARSQLLTANYSVANSVTPAPAYNLTNGMVSTNLPYTPPTNVVYLSDVGTIFYGRNDGAGGTIWSINLDGTGETYITTGARPRASRDGRYLAFSRGANVFTPTGGDVWVRDLQAGVEWELYTNQTGITGYDWDNASPPNLILDSGCNFWSVSLSNTATPFPLPQECGDVAPAVNPVDGSVAYFNGGASVGGLYTGVENGTPSQIFASASAHWPAWSPDGNHLSFAYLKNSYLAQGLADIYTINTNGSLVSQITAFSNPTDGFLHGTIWSPDGNALIGAGTIYGTNGLWIIPLTPDNQHCDCPAILLPTTPGYPIDFAGSVVMAPAAAVAMPGLLIRTDPTAEVVYWSTNYQGFTLEYTTNLAPTAVWTTITGPYFLNGNYFEYHEPIASLLSAKFFRLRYPAIIILNSSNPLLHVAVTPAQTTVSWPTNYAGYTLETTTSLSAPAIWTPAASSSLSSTNGLLQYQELYDPHQPRKFFRLRWP